MIMVQYVPLFSIVRKNIRNSLTNKVSEGMCSFYLSQSDYD